MYFRKLSLTGLLGLLMTGFSNIALSEEMAAVMEEVATINSGDTAWMIMATILVLIMAIPGLASLLWWLSAI